MMHEEFEKITGVEISYRDYSEVIEPMYSALSMENNQTGLATLPTMTSSRE